MSDPSSAAAAPFVEVPLRSRFFQSSAYFPMPVVLLGTRAPDGQANLAPYSLCFPHVTEDGHRMVLVTRSASKTAENLVRSERVTINFIPDDQPLIDNLRLLAQPASTAEKMRQSSFTLIDSERGPAADGGAPPPLVAEAVQVFECTLVRAEVPADDSAERRFVLEVERVAMQPRWAAALEAGRGSPRLPVDYGFRRGSQRWLTRPRALVSGPRLRPKFVIEVERSPEQIKADFFAALNRPGAPVVGKVVGDVVQITLPKAQLTTWSPHVDLNIGPRTAEHDEGEEAPSPSGAVVRGRIGPQPSVWTTFTFFHLLIALTGLSGLMLGISQAVMDESAWALWAVPIALFLHAFIAGAAFIGQGLAADQTYTLRTFLDDVLTE